MAEATLAGLLPAEQRLIDDHGFMVTIAEGNYVVRDPKNKRSGKFEGKRLMDLLQQAVAARGKKKGKPAASPTNPNPKTVSGSNVTTLPTAAPPKPETKPDDPEVDDPDEIEADELDDSGGKKKKTRVAAVKKQPEDWTTGQVGLLILMNPEKTPQEIFDMCEAQGIKTKLLTVTGLRRYFNLCLKLLSKVEEMRRAAAAG